MNGRRAGIDRIAWTVAAICAALQIAWGHALGIDEIEFFRATRWVSLGRVPYRDFWEHHTPLQWYLFAPLARFLNGAGTFPIVFLRWAQLPLWILACRAIWCVARRSGASAQASGVALALLWLSRMFADSAIEYRVEALGVMAFALALAAIMSGRNALAGVSLAMAVIANLRFLPVVAVVLVLIFAIDFDARRWRFVAARWPVVAGAAAAVAAWIAALAMTGSLHAFWRRVIVENAIGDRVMAGTDTFVPVVASMTGIVPHGFYAMLIDPAAIAIVVAATAGAAIALAEIRHPGFLTFLALLHAVNLLFIARMKVVYPYHFLLTFAAAVPLVALALERVAARVVTACVVAAIVVRLLVTTFGANDRVLAWQNFIMTEADRRTLPGEPIFDGVGWVQTRPPAYEYWFLPLLARILAGEGYARPYTVADAIAHPPGALIVEQRVITWFHDYPSIEAYFRSHYVPVNENLWLPGLSGRFDATHRLARWIVPRSGTYRIICTDTRRLTLRRNGIVLATTPVTLSRGDRIEAVAAEPAAVFVIPADVTTLFQRGPGLEAVLPAPPHPPWR